MEKKLTLEQRIALRDLLQRFKTWWNTPAGATGEEERLDQLLDDAEAFAQIVADAE